MKKTVFLAMLTLLSLSVTAQVNPYIVRTKAVKQNAKSTEPVLSDKAELFDFMSRNFHYYSMCDWQEGMRFMVVPEKYDLLMNTFFDAETRKMVSNGLLRNYTMIYQGHEKALGGREHILFHCQEDGKNYYYELPLGASFDTYCFERRGVPTLAYLGDVDKAREMLLGKQLLTRTQHFRVDDDTEDEGYKDILVDNNKVVTVKAIGVGTRTYPVKFIVEDDAGNQFYQSVAMSKTNSGLREEAVNEDDARFLFEGSFEFGDAIMAVSYDVKDYIGKVVHTQQVTTMSSRGSGKLRDVEVPRFTGFIIDDILSIRNTDYYTLMLRETDSRRVYSKDVTFVYDEVDMSLDYFGYLFGMGDGQSHTTSLETRTAIREGRVIVGMRKEEVLMAVGEPFRRTVDQFGIETWIYLRSKGVVLDVSFDERDIVSLAKARYGTDEEKAAAEKKQAASEKKRPKKQAAK